MRNRIREVIKETGHTQREVAKGLGMTHISLNYTCSSPSPRLETLKKIADYLKIPVWRLLMTPEEIDEIVYLNKKLEEKPHSNATCPNCGAVLKITAEVR